MTAENALPSRVTQPSGFPEAPVTTPPEILLPLPFTYPLQERVFSDWRPNLLRAGEAAPARRVAVFKDRVDKLHGLTDGMKDEELDIGGDEFEDLIRYGNYLKILAVDGATSLHIEIGSFIEKKVMEKMQEKYPADYVYDRVRTGRHPLVVMAEFKYMYENGIPVTSIGDLQPISIEEWRDRLPRNPAFRDAHQDVVDTWQRRGYGLYLRASDRLPNVYGEAKEYLDEFEGMSDDEINALAKTDGWISAYDEPQNEQEEKLHAIGGESADVIIGWDGYASAVSDEQDDSVNKALNGIIDRYRKTKKLVGLGIPEPEALRLQREVAHRRAAGLSMPFVGIRAAAAMLGI